MRTVRNTKYKKQKSPNSSSRRYSGRVHLMYWDKTVKAWRFVCGKPDGGAALNYMGYVGMDIDDSEPVTCVRCGKHAPEVVERMDDIPDLDDFQ